LPAACKKPDHMACRGILRIGRLAVEAPEYPSGDDARMLAGQLRIGRDGLRRSEVEIALERKAQRAADGCELEQAHVTEFRLAEPESAKTEGQIDVGVELGQQPGGVAVGGEELDDGCALRALCLVVASQATPGGVKACRTAGVQGL
jgi:hypothetical protein